MQARRAGAGKTLIAVLLVKDVHEKLCQNGQTAKKIFFLAPKVELVKQQADVLRLHSALRVGDYVGEMGLDAWNKATWDQQFEEHDVVVCTPMILLNLLHKAYIEMRDLALIVFDECHHCKKQDPYKLIMRDFYFDDMVKASDRPKIFGMTASPLDTKAVYGTGQVAHFFKELEGSLNAKIITVGDQEKVRETTPLPTMRTVSYRATKLPPDSAVARAHRALEAAHAQLLSQSLSRKNKWHLKQGNRMALDGRLLEPDKLSLETSNFGRAIGRMLHALQEVGGYGALVCLMELLRPTERSMYADIRQESKQQDQDLARIRVVDIDMTLDEDGVDTWWEGSEAGATAAAAAAVKLSAEEEASLCLVLGTIYNAFADLMNGLGCSGLDHLHDDEVMELGWDRMRKQLRTRLAAFEKGIDRSYLARHLFECADPATSLVTPKASKLANLLVSYKAPVAQGQAGSPQRWCCLVFARQKVTCLALARLLQACQAGLGLKTSFLMGYSGQVSALSQNIAAQQKVLLEFKSGRIDVVVATAVAEEGLDVCHCSLVVRFDLPPTAREFIQSRGRARARGSTMALMLQEGESRQLALVHEAIKFETDMLKQAQERASLPGPQMEEGCSAEEEGGLPLASKEYRVPSTGARITISSAKAALFQFCQKLPSDRYAGGLRPRFSTPEIVDNHYRVAAYLPSNSPVKMAEGLPMRTRKLAVSSACLQAVKLLHQAGALSDHLKPDPEEPEAEEDEVPRKGEAAASEEATRTCPISPKWPDLLQRRPGFTAFQLYRVDVRLREGGSAIAMQQCGVVVPNELGLLPCLEVVLDDGTHASLDYQHLQPVELQPQQEQLIKTYHDFLIHRRPSLRSLAAGDAPTRRVANKLKQRKLEERQRFQSGNLQAGSFALPANPPPKFYDSAIELAGMRRPASPAAEKPAGENGPSDAVEDLDHLVSALLGMNMDNDNPPSQEPTAADESSLTEPGLNGGLGVVDGGSDEGIHPRLEEESDRNAGAGALVVPLQGSTIDWTAIEFASNRPSQLEDMPADQLQGKILVPTNYAESQYFRFIRRDERLTLASRMPPRDSTEEASTREMPTFQEHYRSKWGKTDLKPEQVMLEASPLGSKSNIHQAIHLVPQLCVVHPLSIAAYKAAAHVPRILWWLHALLLAKELRSNLLAPGAENDSSSPSLEAFLEAIMPKSCTQMLNYERLEIIGDALLKFETTLHLYRAFPLHHEGQLHNLKIKLVCNKHLSWIGLDLLGLDRFVLVPSLYFRWESGHPLPVLSYRRKVVADVVESLIGAFFMAGGAAAAADFLRRIALLPALPSQPPHVPPYQPPATGMTLKLETLLGYHFKDRQLLREACTHPSWQEGSCYQRLEFLGDAVLDLMVTDTIAKRYPNIEPGRVSDIREAAVNNTRLACVAAAHRCHQAMRHCSAHLLRDIADFVRLFNATLREHTPGEEVARLEEFGKRVSNEALGRTYDQLTDTSYGMELARAPKAMADIVESLAGAVFVDAGYRLEPAFKVLQLLVTPLPTPETVAIHPVRILVERTSKKHLQLRFKVTLREDRLYDVDAYVGLYLISSAEGQSSTKAAKVVAARLALVRWADDFDYAAAAGQAFEPERAASAAAFAASQPPPPTKAEEEEAAVVECHC